MSFIDRLISISRRRSPWVCRLNGGSCNGCDIEITPCLSPRYDVEQIGGEFHGTPKHADIILISGTLTVRTRQAILDIYSQVPNPKAVVAIGSCPASGNVFAGSPMIAGPVDQVIPVDVYIAGCPPRPHSIIQGIAQAIEILVARKETGR